MSAHLPSWQEFISPPDEISETKLTADRLTLELAQKSERRCDRGKRPIEESPLFGGPAQATLFDPTGYEND